MHGISGHRHTTSHGIARGHTHLRRDGSSVRGVGVGRLVIRHCHQDSSQSCHVTGQRVIASALFKEADDNGSYASTLEGRPGACRGQHRVLISLGGFQVSDAT